MTHFTLQELTRSQTAVRKGLDNTPSEAVKLNLIGLIDNILVPVRLHFDSPVIITSGYRSPKVNRSVGGSATSDHCFGAAADFTVRGVSNLAVCQWIVANLDFKQVIYEFGEAGWVHASFLAGQNRKQVLSAKKVSGRTRYLPGLVA